MEPTGGSFGAYPPPPLPTVSEQPISSWPAPEQPVEEQAVEERRRSTRRQRKEAKRAAKAQRAHEKALGLDQPAPTPDPVPDLPPMPVAELDPTPSAPPVAEQAVEEPRRPTRRQRKEAKRAAKAQRAHEKALGLDQPAPTPDPVPDPMSDPVSEQPPAPVAWQDPPPPPPPMVEQPVVVPEPVGEPEPVRERELEPALVGAPPVELTPEERQARRAARQERRAARLEAREADVQAARAAHAAALADTPLTPPTAGNGLQAVFKKRYLLKLLVKREISARYQGSFLGLLWSYIGPGCQFLVYWFVIGQILGLHKEVPNFGIHIFCGLVVVHFFTETFGAGTRSIVRNKSLVVKLALPREMFPVASMLVSLFHVFPQLIILLVACLAYGWTPDLYGMAALGLGFLIAMLLGTGGALLFSAANVFFRDFASLVSIIQMFIRFSVPMIYPFSIVATRFGDAADYYLWNPLADCVLLVQRAFWLGSTGNPDKYETKHFPPDLMLWGLTMVGVGLVVLAIGQFVFSRLESRIPERL